MKFQYNGIRIKPPNEKDAEKMMEFINSLVEEKADINQCKKVTLDEEEKYLKDILKKIKENKLVYLIALDNDKVVGIVSIGLRTGKMSHRGGLGISVAKEYRGKGLGKKLMELIIELAKEKLKGLEMIELSVFKRNKAAKKLYKKFGFKKVATIKKGLKFEGKYFDEEIMALWL